MQTNRSSHNDQGNAAQATNGNVGGERSGEFTTHDNTEQEAYTRTKSQVTVEVMRFESGNAHKKRAEASIAIAFTLLLTFVTTNFNNSFGVSSAVLQGGFYTLFVLLILFAIYSYNQWRASGEPKVESTVNKILGLDIDDKKKQTKK